MAFTVRSILIPVDFGAGSDHALEYGLDLAASLEKQLSRASVTDHCRHRRGERDGRH